MTDTAAACGFGWWLTDHVCELPVDHDGPHECRRCNGPAPTTTAATDDGPVTSNRTHERATALAWMRGCEQDNGCWPDCYDAALSAVVEDRLDDVERTWATTSTYWKLTHGVSPRDI